MPQKEIYKIHKVHNFNLKHTNTSNKKLFKIFTYECQHFFYLYIYLPDSQESNRGANI